jgi:methyl-branched lipid omega-hydroxylase
MSVTGSDEPNAEQPNADAPAAAPIEAVLDQIRQLPWWSQGSEERAWAFRRLRDEAPVVFTDEVPIPGFPPGRGFWSLTRYADVVHASRHPDLFCSGQGTNIPDLPIEIAEFYGSMINMDAPRHTRLRRIVNRAFTPRMVDRIDADVRARARRIVAEVAPLGRIDVVTQLAAPLPLQIICEMMGIPRESWQRIFELTNVILGDMETTPDLGALMAASLEMAEIARQVGEDRLAEPRDDLVSAMVHAEVDGEALEPMELASFFILLAAAGNETTRNAIAHGLRLLTLHEDQRAIWQADVSGVTPTAVEEIVRWATPVVHFRRTATADTEIGGVRIAEGDKVVLWFESANRDERAFDDPFRFDITRAPNEHVGFGAGGPHFCLGANLARRELRVMFEELFRWLPDIRTVDEPAWLCSSFINGIKQLDAEFTPAEVPDDALTAEGLAAADAPSGGAH